MEILEAADLEELSQWELLRYSFFFFLLSLSLPFSGALHSVRFFGTGLEKVFNWGMCPLISLHAISGGFNWLDSGNVCELHTHNKLTN